MKNKNQSLSGLSKKDKIMECFEKNPPRKEIWRKFPDVPHKTIRQYHWLWKEKKEKKEREEKMKNPYYAASELIRSFGKEKTLSESSSKPEPNKKKNITRNIEKKEPTPITTKSITVTSDKGSLYGIDNPPSEREQLEKELQRLQKIPPGLLRGVDESNMYEIEKKITNFERKNRTTQTKTIPQAGVYQKGRCKTTRERT